MRTRRALALALALASVTSGARADAVAWGGRIGRVSVSVELSGFREGTGVGGWSEGGARWFAAWAARVESMLPPGATLEIVTREMDGELVADVTRSGGGHEPLALGVREALPGDLDAVLPRLATHFGVAVPPARADVPLYTVQLAAMRSEPRASAFARDFEDHDLEDGRDDVFYENCVPCWIPRAHVLAPDARGFSRVVVGLYADRASARAALVRLRRGGRRGFVRTL